MKKSILFAILLALCLTSSAAYANEAVNDGQNSTTFVHTSSSYEAVEMPTEERDTRERLLPYTQREILKNIDVNVNVNNTPNPQANGQGLQYDNTNYSLAKDSSKELDEDGNEIEGNLHPLSDIKVKVNVQNAPDLSTTVQSIKRNPITGTITIDMTNNPTAEPIDSIKERVAEENYKLGNMPNAIEAPRDKTLYEVWKAYAPRGAYNNPNALIPLDPAYTDAIKPKPVQKYTAPAPKPVAPPPPAPEPVVAPEPEPEPEPVPEPEPEPVVEAPKEPTQQQKDAANALLPSNIVLPPPADSAPPVILQDQGQQAPAASTNNAPATTASPTPATNTTTTQATTAPATPTQETPAPATPAPQATSTIPVPATASSVQNTAAAQSALNPNGVPLPTTPPPASSPTLVAPQLPLVDPSAAMSQNSPPPATE